MKYNMAFPYFPEEDIKEIIEETKAILSGQAFLTMGEKVATFEKKFAQYVGTQYAIATNSCTSALEISLRVIGLQPGDEVIVPAQTFIATGSSVVINGGKVVFADVDENFLLDFNDVKARITQKTKAVIMVHFAGLIHPQILAIKEYLKKKGIYLIEDAAHAHGAKINNTFAGNLGDLGCFSFYSTKIMTTGEGGMITVNDPSLAKLCNSTRNRGLDVEANSEIFTQLGSNRRFTEFQALLGLAQLKRLEDFVAHRNKIANIYKRVLSPLRNKGLIRFQDYAENVRHAYWRFVIWLSADCISREQLKEQAQAHGIKIDWPYSPLLHLQPVFQKLYGTDKNSLSKAEARAKNHFCLPMHYQIKAADAEFIANKILEIING